jgi:cytochrome d ubiquinol oxidase subunit I
MDVLALSRLQFALTSAFHYLYPPLSIGLGLILVMVEGLWLATDNPVFHQMARFWTRVFALTFALGVATGLVLEFEFGTNWAAYARYVGDVFGSALAAEGIFAFFLESGFLAVLLFGWDKVSRRVHFLATCLVCFGAHFSAIWIVVANSWMQTPAGFHIVGQGLAARAEITDFWRMVFNPSALDRLLHVLGGAWLAGAFLVVSVSAWYLLRERHEEFARKSLRLALAVDLAAAIFQLFSGHRSAVGVARHQPAKLAAFEGLYQTAPQAGLALWGWVDEGAETVRGGLVLPGWLSWLAHGDAAMAVTGLREFKPEDRPPVNLTFQAYHAMVALGLVMIAMAALGFLQFRLRSVAVRRWVLRLLVLSVAGPQVANQLGWLAAEVGRQPWLVYHQLRTPAGLSPVVSANTVLVSLLLFSAVYALLFVLFLYLLNDKIRHGPDLDDLTPAGKLAWPGRATEA